MKALLRALAVALTLTGAIIVPATSTATEASAVAQHRFGIHLQRVETQRAARLAHRRAQEARVRRRIATRRRAWAGPLGEVPGVPRVFAACVAMYESTDGELSTNIYGMLSYVPGSSVIYQKHLFQRMYKADGIEPWEPYDHCTLSGHE